MSIKKHKGNCDTRIYAVNVILYKRSDGFFNIKKILCKGLGRPV